jgi:hypothetical protein
MEKMPTFTAMPQSVEKNKEQIRLEAHAKATALFEREAIDENSFLLNEETGEGVYSKEMIDKNLAEVARLDNIFASEKNNTHPNQEGSNNNEVKEYGDILEAIILNQVESWFSSGDGKPSPKGIKTAKFDDYKNGVDLLVELEGGEKPLALAVDVTFGFKGLEKKINRILLDIERGDLGSVRYYKSSDSRFEGKISKLPKVVIGLEMDTVQALAKLWIENEDSLELKKHFTQTLILSEIVLQLRAYREYALDHVRSDLAEIYEIEMEKISSILEFKPDSDMDNADRVYTAITQITMDIERGRRVAV